MGNAPLGIGTTEAVNSSSKSSSRRMVTVRARFQGAVEEMGIEEMETTSISCFCKNLGRETVERERAVARRDRGVTEVLFKGVKDVRGQHLQVQGPQPVERGHIEI